MYFCTVISSFLVAQKTNNTLKIFYRFADDANDWLHDILNWQNRDSFSK